jgi:hypothetical protein
VALIFAAAGLLLAVTTVGGDLYRQFTAGGLRRLGALAMAVVASAPPVLAAVFWVVNGAAGPLTRIAAPVLPEFVSISSAGGARLRTLVLRPDGGSVDYTVLRGSDPPLGAGELTEPASASSALARLVAALTAPGGSGTGDLGGSLASFGIGYVLLPAPINQTLARQIDGVVGVRPVSHTTTFELWKVAETVARVRVTEPGGAQVALPSGTVNMTNAAAPAAGGTVVLAEPASGDWQATLNGHPLTRLPSPVDGWAQGFRLPSGGGRLSITRDETGRTIVLAVELVALLAVAVLALPGAKEPAAAAAETGGARRSSRAVGTARGGGSRSAGAGTASGGGGRRGVRARDAKPAVAAGRGTRGSRAQGSRTPGGRAPGRRRRTGADGTGPNARVTTEAVPRQPAWEVPDEPVTRADSPWAEPGLDELPPDRDTSGGTVAQYALPPDDEDSGWRDEQPGWSSSGPVSGAREADW